MISLLDWQQPSAAEIAHALTEYGVVADGSDTGTGKTYKVVAHAAAVGRPLVVLCPKSMIPEWERVAELGGVSCVAVNYEKVRTGKTKQGNWQVKGKVFEWTIPNNAILVFDEAHRCGGQGTQNATLLIAAKRQRIPLALLSATLIGSPLRAYAIGYALDVHRLTNFWQWARQNGVRDGFFGPEWAPDKMEPPREPEDVMQSIRTALGDRFTRIRKADVPGFPVCQNIPTFVQTEEMPDLDSDYSVEARAAVELLKVPGLVEKCKALVDDEGMSVAIFVNFRATLKALQEAFPKAVSVFGGQTTSERHSAINSFQQNETHVILLMAQAGGTGVSLHDLNGRPRAALVCPGYDAVEFLQVLGRIHRAGSLSPAMNFIVFASGVPVERRIRARLEQKLTNLTALNDYDLASSNAQSPSDSMTKSRKIIPGAIDVQATVINSEQPVPSTAVPSAAVTTATVAHVERKHARCSPSKLKNLEICPSYEGDNDGPVHPVTLRGTAMHEALEKDDDSKLDPDGVEGVIPGANVEHELVTMCRDYQDGEKVPGEIVILEPHLKTHDKDVQGFADRVVIDPPDANGRRKARIRDYKFGFNLVDLPNINPQAVAYTVAVFMEHLDVDEINFAFLIPRLDSILEHTFYRHELPELKLRLSTIAERVRKLSGKEFNPNYENCLYCGRKATCTEMHKKMLPLAAALAPEDRLPLPPVLDLEQITEPQHLAWLLNLANTAESFAEKTKAFALRYRLELGQEIPGYDLIERKGKREITDPNGAYQVATAEFGVTPVEFIAASKISITSLEASVRAHAPQGDKEKVAGQFTDRLMDANALSRGGSFHVLQRSRKKAKPALPAAA